MQITSPPDGLDEQTPEWHLEKLIEFTRFKGQIGEPSPHLAIMGHFCKDIPLPERVWRLSCYAAVYCLPTAQVLWTKFPLDQARTMDWEPWLTEHWKGIITRTERRCIRTPQKLARCLRSAVKWTDGEFPILHNTIPGVVPDLDAKKFYEEVWESVNGIEFFGRYIAIRFIEGLRRYCEIPAELPDMRSIGGWSPKKALSYLYPEHAVEMLTTSKQSDKLADDLAADLMVKFSEAGYPTNYYTLAAMLCEYRGAFENQHQYPGWTIDQEPLMYDKVEAYWGKDLATAPMWEARKLIFPEKALGEFNGWHGTRWDLTKTIRKHGYNWSDLKYDFVKTSATGDFSQPVER